MNSRGWRYLPPVLQTKHNFYLCSDLWLLQAEHVGQEEGPTGQGAGAEPLLPPVPVVLSSIDIQRRMHPFVKHYGGFRRNPSTQINYCYLYPLGPGPPACLSSAAARTYRNSHSLSAFLSLSLSFSPSLTLFFFFTIYFCFNLHIIISAKTSEITSDK